MDNLAPGVMNFQVESNPPNFELIPQDEIVGIAFCLFRYHRHIDFSLIRKAGIL